MKFITLNEIAEVNPREECFVIKNFVPKSSCDSILNLLMQIKCNFLENQKFLGNNKFYSVEKSGTYFDSFIFHELFNLNNSELIDTYKKLFYLYISLGEKLRLDWEEHLFNRIPCTEKSINPLIFSYPAGIGRFESHQHPDDYQKFQLLVNLTEPSIDYNGGFTHIKMAEDEVEIFDHSFQKGDVFSFPYNKWHHVEPILNGSSQLNSRVSLLMPLHPKSGIPTNYNTNT